MKKITAPAKMLLLLATMMAAQTLYAQTDKLGGWHIANLNYHLSKSVVLYAEVQARSQKLTDDFYYHELKSGEAYNFPQRNSLFLGW